MDSTQRLLPSTTDPTTADLKVRYCLGFSESGSLGPFMSYVSFQATPVGSQQSYECSFHTLTTGIAPRHSDTVDVKFMIGGRPIVIALPHRAFAEFKRSANRPLTDREA